MYAIDSVDCEIVELLMQDGRMPAAEISRRLGGQISERIVRYRISRLIEEGIISICAIPNPRAVGYKVVADIFVEVETGLIEEVAQMLTQHENISYVSCSIGERDISVQVVARDNNEVYNLATEYIGNLPGVRKTVTSIVPITLKDVYQWRIPRSVCITR